MEKFFRVKEGSRYHKECTEYKENLKAVKDTFTQLCENVGLEVEQYVPYSDALYIVTTPEVEEKFGKQLAQPSRGVRAFKKNSKVHKMWIDMLRQKQLKVLQKPCPAWWIPGGINGRFSTRIFPVNDVWYGSIHREYAFGDLPEGLEEMKASEFYKIMEGDE